MKLVLYEYLYSLPGRDDQVLYGAEANEDSVEDLIASDALAELNWFPVKRPLPDRPYWERRINVNGKRDVSRFRRLLRAGGAELERRSVTPSEVQEWVQKYEQSRQHRKPGVGRLP